MSINNNIHQTRLLALIIILIVGSNQIKLSSRHRAVKDNLLAQNWYYGHISITDYRLRLFEKGAESGLDPCPLERPFATVDLNSCMSCPRDKPLRNLAYFVCQRCPDNEGFDSEIGNCSKSVSNQQKLNNSPTDIHPRSVMMPSNKQTASMIKQKNDSNISSAISKPQVQKRQPDLKTEKKEQSNKLSYLWEERRINYPKPAEKELPLVEVVYPQLERDQPSFELKPINKPKPNPSEQNPNPPIIDKQEKKQKELRYDQPKDPQQISKEDKPTIIPEEGEQSEPIISDPVLQRMFHEQKKQQN